MKNILIINQSSELYGSDKALLELLENYPRDYKPIVVLENEGILKDILIKKGIQVIKCPVIKLKKSYYSFTGIFKVFWDILKSIYLIRKCTKNLKIDLVQSNTISVFLGAFYSFFFRKKHLWHVHEIVESPIVVAKMYPKIVNFFSDKIIFNSKASYNHFYKFEPKIQKKSEIIYNGQTRYEPFIDEIEKSEIIKNIFKANHNDIIIGLVGRISRWKGQFLLLDSFNELVKTHTNVHLVFIGSTPPGQNHFLTNLKFEIEKYRLQNKVTIIDFQKDIWKIYDSIDISVVPSIEPEPFGLVATESMLSQKPIIGANHGGLNEIILDNITGLLFEPRNVFDLQEKLELLINNPMLRNELGENGKKRVKDYFSTHKFIEGFERVYEEMLYYSL